jgi:virginiamycin B lyase
MNQIQFGEQNHETNEHQPPEPRGHQPSRRRRSSHWSTRQRHNAWFMLVLALLGVIAVVVLANSTARFSGPSNTALPGTTSTISSTPATILPTTMPAIMAIGNFHEYPLPQSDTQMMRPAIDHEGRIWFGEMGHNALAAFDPHWHTFQQIAVPDGRSGLMGLQVANDDTVWFVEQYANYIGHYFPKTGRFQTYPLPWLTVPDPSNVGHTLILPSGPNELALDGHGNAWFTEFNADELGRLDTHTGRIQHYPLLAQKSVQTLYPYGITIDAQGMVWFTESGNNHIGRLDPATGDIRFFIPAGPEAQLMEIASAPDGTIWATAFTPGLLLRLDPRTGSFTSYYAPFTGSDKSGLYGLLVTPTDEVWVTISAENVIARLDVATNRFLYYSIPTKASLPLGLVMDATDAIWFTEVDNIGMLRP